MPSTQHDRRTPCNNIPRTRGLAHVDLAVEAAVAVILLLLAAAVAP